MNPTRPVAVGDGYTVGYTLFLVTYWAIVFVMFLSIIQGIIVDTFARTLACVYNGSPNNVHRLLCVELRDRKNLVESDMKKRCFICSIDRYMFDRLEVGGMRSGLLRYFSLSRTEIFFVFV